MALISVEPSVIILMNTASRISITIQNSAGVNTDPFDLTLDVLDIGSNIKLTDIWPAPAVRLIRTAVGKFYIDFGNQLVNDETNGEYEWVFNWRITMVSGGSQTQSLQNVKIISAKMASLIPDLRLIIDKSRKLVSPASQCYLGYTEANLVRYIQAGLETINAYQPSLTFTTANFPFEYRQILLDAALISGVMSQQLYAVDTDLNYNDSGISFVITHQQQLASFLTQVTTQLDKLIPQMKLQLINSGRLHVQTGPNFRLTQLIQTAPNGSIFRGIYFKP